MNFLPDNNRSVFAIFEITFFGGLTPTWREESGFPVIYTTEREAQIEIAGALILQLEQFIAGGCEFDDARSTSDFILPIKVWSDGSIGTERGRRFGAEPW